MSLGEPNVKRALDWVLAELREDPDTPRGRLIDQASRRFDLTPLQADFLYRKLTESST